MDCSRAETKRVERVVGIIGNVACNRISPKYIVCRLLDCGVFRCSVAGNTHRVLCDCWHVDRQVDNFDFCHSCCFSRTHQQTFGQQYFEASHVFSMHMRCSANVTALAMKSCGHWYAIKAVTPGPRAAPRCAAVQPLCPNCSVSGSPCLGRQQVRVVRLGHNNYLISSSPSCLFWQNSYNYGTNFHRCGGA
jgi:hypothetical protein